MDVSLPTFWTRINFLAPWVAVFRVYSRKRRDEKGTKRTLNKAKEAEVIRCDVSNPLEYLCSCSNVSHMTFWNRSHQ